MPKGPPPKGLALPVDDDWRQQVLDALDAVKPEPMEQKELAKKVHVAPSAISQLLKMSKDAGAKTVKTSRVKAKINEVLGLPATNLGFHAPGGASPRLLDFLDQLEDMTEEQREVLYRMADIILR